MTRISKIQRSVYLRYYGIEHKKKSSLHFDENKKKKRNVFLHCGLKWIILIQWDD